MVEVWKNHNISRKFDKFSYKTFFLLPFFYANGIMGSNGTPLTDETRGLRFADWMKFGGNAWIRVP